MNSFNAKPEAPASFVSRFFGETAGASGLALNESPTNLIL